MNVATKIILSSLGGIALFGFGFHLDRIPLGAILVGTGAAQGAILLTSITPTKES